eukprot:COSAG02_NODE_2797_length_8012_cov_3.512827_2_plen_73_part_00
MWLVQGPFEAMELCDAMDDVTCIITLFGGMTGETGHAAKRCAAMEHPPNQVCRSVDVQCGTPMRNDASQCLA